MDCKECGKTFDPKRPWQRFCCTKCRTKFHNHEKYMEAKELRRRERLRMAVDYHVY